MTSSINKDLSYAGVFLYYYSMSEECRSKLGLEEQGFNLVSLVFSMASEKKTSLSNVEVWVMKVISCVGIIMVNKQLMSGYNFRFGMFELFVFIKFHLNNCLMDTFSRKKFQVSNLNSLQQ